MTTFREYRQAMAGGAVPDHDLPTLPSDVVEFQGERAGFVSRAVAASIDVLLVFLVVLATIAGLWMLSYIVNPTSPLSAFDESRVPPTVLMIGYGYCLNVLYWTIGWATGGRTIGNMIMGLRVVNFRGEKVSWVGAFVRAVFCTLFIPGLLWVIVSGANRSVQDVVLRTSVIYDWVFSIPGFSRKAGVPRPPEPTTGRSQ